MHLPLCAEDQTKHTHENTPCCKGLAGTLHINIRMEDNSISNRTGALCEEGSRCDNVLHSSSRLSSSNSPFHSSQLSVLALLAGVDISHLKVILSDDHLLLCKTNSSHTHTHTHTLFLFNWWQGKLAFPCVLHRLPHEHLVWSSLVATARPAFNDSP